MPVKVSDGVEVPTLEEFRKLLARVEELEKVCAPIPRRSAKGFMGIESQNWVAQDTGWRPSRVMTNLPCEIMFTPTGFRARSDFVGQVSWEAME